MREDTGIQKETNEHIESIFGKHHTKFNSRSELFKHLEEKNHMLISESDKDDHMNNRQIKGAMKINSRSDRTFKQLSIHKHENFKEVGSIGD